MNHFESIAQIALFEWAARLEFQFPELSNLYANANGGKRDAREAGRLKREGVRSGVPDIQLAVPVEPYHGLYIELKIGKNKTSNNQDDWIQRLRKQGYKVEVCIGWESAAECIEEYLKVKGVSRNA